VFATDLCMRRSNALNLQAFDLDQPEHKTHSKSVISLSAAIRVFEFFVQFLERANADDAKLLEIRFVQIPNLALQQTQQSPNEQHQTTNKCDDERARYGIDVDALAQEHGLMRAQIERT
jgi:hypothetical protein